MTVTRGTTNTNQRGNTKDRAARRAWLLETYRADVDGYWRDGVLYPMAPHVNPERAVRCCRCYRCGKLLDDTTVTADRIIPGCQGGTYVRSNIRPACGTCQSTFGGSQRSTK